jgi:hypothetical protein
MSYDPYTWEGSMAGRIRRFFSLGRTADAISVLVYVAPGLTISAVTASAVGYWSAALIWVQHPYVYVPAFVFLFVLWTYIGIMVLTSRGSVQTVKIAHEYAYALITDGGGSVQLIQTNDKHPTHPNTTGLSIQLNFRNVSAGPIRVRVDEFRVNLDNRSSQDPDTTPTLIMARLSPRGVRSGIVPRDANKTNLFGTLTARLTYGPPDGPYCRQYRARERIEVVINQVGQVLLSDEIIEEADVAYTDAI